MNKEEKIRWQIQYSDTTVQVVIRNTRLSDERFSISHLIAARFQR